MLALQNDINTVTTGKGKNIIIKHRKYIIKNQPITTTHYIISDDKGT